MIGDATRTAIEAVWRIESARLIGGLVRMVRDVGLAEDLAQDALVTALERWPETGSRRTPARGSWRPRRTAPSISCAGSRCCERKHEELGHEALDAGRERRARPRGGARRGRGRRPPAARPHRLPPGAVDRGARRAHPAAARRAHDRGDRAGLPGPGADHRAAHRARQADARRGAGAVRGAARRRARRAARLGARGRSTSSSTRATRRPRGDDWMRPALCEDALRLGPHPRRARARRAGGARPGRADGAAGVAHRARASALVASRSCSSTRTVALGPAPRPSRPRRARPRRGASRRPLGPYTLQAAIAACHARARTADETDWKRIVALYDALVELTRSPVVELNRAVAVSMAFGPAAGLELVDALVDEPALRALPPAAERPRRSPGQARPHRRGPRASSSAPPSRRRTAGSERCSWHERRPARRQRGPESTYLCRTSRRAPPVRRNRQCNDRATA